MRRRRVRTVLAMLAAMGLMTSTSQALTTISNGVYEVHVADEGDSSIGSWNAITGAEHPTGADNNLLFEGTTVETNFSSLRVYSGPGAGDYTFGAQGDGTATNLDDFVTGSGPSAFGANGFQITWGITPAGLTLTQDLVIAGDEFENSGIYHTVEITNTGEEASSIGWRNLYDWTINNGGFDDGPSNAVELADGTTVIPESATEFSYDPETDSLVRVSAFPDPADYEPLLGLGFDPGFLDALTTTLPDEYAFVSWPDSVFTNFEYLVDPTLDVASVEGIDDSAGLSWFGRDIDSAINLAPGESVRFTQTIFGVAPGQEVPGGPGQEPGEGVIPEPMTASLGLLGLGVLGWATRRRRA